MYDGSNIHDKRLIQKELKRVKSFTDLSLNADETYEQIRPLLIKYGIEEEI